MQEIAWVLGRVSADGIVQILHAHTLHVAVVGVFELVREWMNWKMSKAKRPKRTR